MQHWKASVWNRFVRLLLAGFVLVWGGSTVCLLADLVQRSSLSWEALGAWGTITAAGIAAITYRDGRGGWRRSGNSPESG